MKNQNLLNILKRFKIEHGIEDISEKNLKKFIITIRSKQKKNNKVFNKDMHE